MSIVEANTFCVQEEAPPAEGTRVVCTVQLAPLVHATVSQSAIGVR